MRRGVHGGIAELGEAISIESALTVMVVIILLRLLFFIPLVKIDRAKLEDAQHDIYWKKATEWLAAQTTDTAAARPYLQTFGLENNIVRVSDIGAKRCYLEALSPDSEITVIMHDQRAMRTFLLSSRNTAPWSPIVSAKCAGVRRNTNGLRPTTAWITVKPP